jgi:membrane protease YdiL (CAAX protease family)
MEAVPGAISQQQRQAAMLAVFPFVALSLANHLYKPALYGAGMGWYWLADGLHFVLVPLAGYFVLLRPAGIGAADLGLGRARIDEALLAGFLLLCATWPVGKVMETLTWEYADAFMPQGFRGGSYTAKVAIVAYMSVTAALFEEVAFRALPWLCIRHRAGRAWLVPAYICGTSLVFAFCHTEQGFGGVIATFWFGVAAAFVYLRARSLWHGIAGHFMYDMIAFGPW